MATSQMTVTQPHTAGLAVPAVGMITPSMCSQRQVPLPTTTADEIVNKIGLCNSVRDLYALPYPAYFMVITDYEYYVPL